MSLAADLLQQAQHLLKLDSRKPKQANLRRSISTAYYSLFSLLVDEAAVAVVGSRMRKKLLRGYVIIMGLRWDGLGFRHMSVNEATS